MKVFLVNAFFYEKFLCFRKAPDEKPKGAVAHKSCAPAPFHAQKMPPPRQKRIEGVYNGYRTPFEARYPT